MEDFTEYRTMCANRLRRLERYKKARSFCNLEEEVNSSNVLQDAYNRLEAAAESAASPSCSQRNENENSPFPTAFDAIREKMFSLMENDLHLLQQLLTLGDQISEIKQGGVRRSASEASLDVDGHEAEDEFEDRFSSSMCAITTLYVDDSEPQYFSRKNSVLRIPIPPRSSNRFGNRRLPRRPSELLRHPAAASTSVAAASGNRCLHVNSDDTESESCSSEGPHSPRNGTLPSSVCSTSTSTVSYSTSSASTSSVGVKNNRSSNSSIDSGAISCSSPSPTFERQI